MKKTKLKLRKEVYYVFAGVVFIIVGIILGINYYNDSLYKKTMEYQFIQKGYSLDDFHLLKEKLKEEDLPKILEKDKNENIILLVQEKYFLMKNLDLYLEYMEKEEKDRKDVVAIVNVHANKNWYENTEKTDTSLKEKILVNKFYSLEKDYTPENLTFIPLEQAYGNYKDNALVDYAYDHFMNLWNDAKKDGFHFMVNTSYRDYNSQQEIYENIKKNRGEKEADSEAARPGHSEHQTGLVVDMTSLDAKVDEDFKDSEAYHWLKQNAYKYGFIERYPEGKTYITGYNPESWHWRYVGIDAATTCYKENITYDEYYAYYIES